jgi:hypothetical protein
MVAGMYNGVNNGPYTGTTPTLHPINSLTNAPSQSLITSSCYNNALPIGPCGSNYSSPKKKARMKSGFKLDATSIKEPKPSTPRRERRETHKPEIVGGGPMRRRWR